MSQLKIKEGNTWVNIPAGGVGVPAGGSEGQYLIKSSSTDYATEWHTLEPQFLIVDQSGTWTVPGNGGLTYVDANNIIPEGYTALSANFEVTSSLQYSSWINVLNPTYYYDNTAATVKKAWMTRLRNNHSASLTVQGTIHYLCAKN